MRLLAGRLHAWLPSYVAFRSMGAGRGGKERKGGRRGGREGGREGEKGGEGEGSLLAGISVLIVDFCVAPNADFCVAGRAEHA